jgi:PAS domain S-box-containing protein
MEPRGELSDEASRAAARRALGALSVVAPVGIVAVDPDGRSWYHNQRWEDFSGTPGRSLRSRPWYLAVHADDADDVAARWKSSVDRQGRFGAFRTIGPDGAVRHCEGQTVPMVDGEGETDGYLIVIVDADPTGTAADPTGTAGTAVGPVLSGAQLLDVVLDRSLEIVTILNPDGSWRWSSGGALRLIGHQADFDPQDGIFRLLHPDDVDAARGVFARAVAGEIDPDERFEMRLRTADGSWRYMEVIVESQVDHPAIRGIVVHARDVTRRHDTLAALEASNRWLSGLIDSMQTGVVLEDEQRAVVLVNQAFVDLFHLPFRPDDVCGRTLESIGLSVAKLVVDPPDAADAAVRLRAQPERIAGVRATLVDGRTLECDFVPMYVHGTYRGHLSTYRDITNQALAEAERERLLASERDENRRLAEMDAFRSESLAAVSHELRTPLTSIVGYTQLLGNLLDRNGVADADATEQVACLDAIVRNVNRLLRLAGDLVGLDSLESRALPLDVSPVDIAAAVRHAERTIAPDAAARSVAVELDVTDGPPLVGDADRLTQLFENILSNAVKFTPADGRVTVRAAPIGDGVDGGGGADGEGGGGPGGSRGAGGDGRGGGGDDDSDGGDDSEDGWEVEIADTGIGIPDDEQALLFSRFFRASNARTRGLPGTGLGLSVAKAIIDRHGGTISIRSIVGAGTCVLVRLPNGAAVAGDANGGGEDGDVGTGAEG